MKSAKNIEKLISKINVTPDARMEQRTLDEMLGAQEKTKNTLSVIIKPNTWRIIMKSKITKLATATVMVIALLIGINMLNGTPAWAIEQSIQAHHSVRSIFVKSFQSKMYMGKGGSFDFWLKYDSAGEISHFRADAAKSPDGKKTIILSDGVLKVWMPEKNGLMLFRGTETKKAMEEFASNFDPKQTLQRLYDSQSTLDESEMDIIQPEKAGDPVIFEIRDNAESYYLKYFFDAETKLLIQFEKYRLTGESYELDEKFEFFKYNQFIDDSLFELNDIPDDALIIDQATEEVGIEKGDMTNDEAAMEVVRQCLEAAIVQDYQKVKKMLGGMPGDSLEIAFCGNSGGKILRIVSIDKPVPHEKWKHILCVPCRIEFETPNGNRIASFKPHVKRLENQPGNKWSICGGI